MVESAFPSLAGGTAVLVFGIGAEVTWRYDAANSIWLIATSAKLGSYREVWQATPITNLVGQTIQWTFVPLFTGQTPLIASHAAGVFTFGNDITFDVSIECDFDFNMTNNSEVQVFITPNYTGTGTMFLGTIRIPFQSSRIGTFDATAQRVGDISANASDTLSFVADDLPIGADSDLDAAVLVFTL